MGIAQGVQVTAGRQAGAQSLNQCHQDPACLQLAPPFDQSGQAQGPQQHEMLALVERMLGEILRVPAASLVFFCRAQFSYNFV